MRLNQFIAAASGLSRRAADAAIKDGRVNVNGQLAHLGQAVSETDQITLDGKLQQSRLMVTTIMLNKPPCYVCSRDGQGSMTIYDLLPPEYHSLKSIGRLDKDSSGLILLTNDGQLANELTHPRYAKVKTYEVALNKPLVPADKIKIEQGIKIDDYVSRLQLSEIGNPRWRVTMHQGRNRQIRRTFTTLGYSVIDLNRTIFGEYQLKDLSPGQWKILHKDD